jgi:type IV pilus assembly protein PilX
MKTIHNTHTLPSASQRGAALVISLILLVVITLVGLASIRSTQLQESMSGNMYDRSLAFQRAESALRAAEDAIIITSNITTLGGVDCSITTGSLCKLVPDSTFTSTNTNWTAVAATHDVNNAKAPGNPEYHIQFMGTGKGDNALGLEQNADFANYGNNYPPDNVAYYRVTARSSNPGPFHRSASEHDQAPLLRLTREPKDEDSFSCQFARTSLKSPAACPPACGKVLLQWC